MLAILDPAQRRVSKTKDICMYTFIVSRTSYVKNAIATSTMAPSCKAHLAQRASKAQQLVSLSFDPRDAWHAVSSLCLVTFGPVNECSACQRRRKEGLKKDPRVDPTLGPKSRIGGLDVLEPSVV
jgi:hypothetical protein